MSTLVRIAPGALVVGKPLPWTVYDADGTVLLCQGYVIQSNMQLEQLFERGLFHPRVIERAQDEPDATGQLNPFAEYPILLKTLETTLKAITAGEENALKRLLGLTRVIERICDESPDASLALVHLYSVEPTIHEQILFYGILCHSVARAFGLNKARTSMLTSAALVANIGLVPVADQLNASRMILNDEQRAVIRKHPQRSMQALHAAGIRNKALLEIIAQHHEQADGTGYPKGLSGTDICAEAEMLSLAERYVAMITKRAYRERMNATDARKLIASLADGQILRPAIPRALLTILTDYPPGTLVRLSNDEVGLVTRRPVRHRGPFVQAIFSPKGKRYSHTIERDCSEPLYSVLALEEPEVMPSMDFSLLWGLS